MQMIVGQWTSATGRYAECTGLFIEACNTWMGHEQIVGPCQGVKVLQSVVGHGVSARKVLLLIAFYPTWWVVAKTHRVSDLCVPLDPHKKCLKTQSSDQLTAVELQFRQRLELQNPKKIITLKWC